MAITVNYNFVTTLAETVANTWTPNDQITPKVIGLSNGGTVVAYVNDYFNGSNYVLLNFFDPAGAVIGNYKVPYSGGTSSTGEPSITQLSDGNILVSWDENEAGNQGIKARLFTPAGNAVGTELDLTGISALFNDPEIAALTGGGFVMTYEFNHQVFARIYNNAGVQQGNFIAIGGISTPLSDPVVAALDDGGFTIAYVDATTGNNNLTIRAYDSDGTARRVNPYLLDDVGNNADPAIAALSGGKSVVVYTDTGWGDEGGTNGISLTILNADGTISYGAIHVNTGSSGVGENEIQPAVTVLENGFIVVTWSYTSALNPGDIYGRIFTEAGAPISINGSTDPFSISQDATADLASTVSAMLDGEFVVMWQDSETDANSDGRISRMQTELTRTMTGDEQRNVLIGDVLADTLIGLAGNDTLNGGEGNDILRGGAGADHLLAGDGDDILYVDADDLNIHGGAGYDRLFAEANSLALNVNLALSGLEYAQGGNWNDVFNATNVTQAVKLWGHGRNDTLTGSAFDDYLNGGAGNDTLNGLAGADILDGNIGADIFHAGAGNDIMYIDAEDTVIDGGADYDRVYVRGYSDGVVVDMTAGNLEFANGNTLDDEFDATGANWSVKLLGQGGNDTLTGGAMNDQLYGSDGVDIIIGNGGADIISGGVGADELYGAAGNDIIFIDASDTAIDGGADYDRVYVDATSAGVTLNMTAANVEFAYGGNNNDIFNAAGSAVAVKIQGRGGNDILSGGNVADQIYGGVGSDILFGNGGNDLLSGGGADGAVDTFFFLNGWGADTISDFQDGEDILNLSTLGTNFAALTIAAMGANHTLVSFGGDSITLLGMQVADVDASDFVFV